MIVNWSKALDRIGPDPLHVLRSTAPVMRSARDVSIDADAIATVADRFLAQRIAPEWDASLHHPDWMDTADTEMTVTWILIIDALNFCFWGQEPDPDVRWRVEPPGTFEGDRSALLDGYVALVAALGRGVGEGQHLLDPVRLATIDAQEVADLLRPAAGQAPIPLLDARVDNIRELGRGLTRLGGDRPATGLLRAANVSAITLIRRVVQLFPSFNDVASWRHAETGLPNNEVRFYKRAQILAGDLSGALPNEPLAQFHDLDQLTAFADYKVPQVLQWLGILRYSDTLTARIGRRELIPAGSDPEVEIRAGTIWAVELLRQALADRDRSVSAHQLDWLLWEQGQSLPKSAHSYHRTPTMFY